MALHRNYSSNDGDWSQLAWRDPKCGTNTIQYCCSSQKKCN